jgi:hypothetical protein
MNPPTRPNRLRIARKELTYASPLSTRQFLTPGAFGEQRVLLLADILKLLQQHHEKSTPRNATRRQFDDALAKLTSSAYDDEGVGPSNGIRGFGYSPGPSNDPRRFDLSTEEGLTSAIAKLLQCDVRSLQPFRGAIVRTVKKRTGQISTGMIGGVDDDSGHLEQHQYEGGGDEEDYFYGGEPGTNDRTHGFEGGEGGVEDEDLRRYQQPTPEHTFGYTHQFYHQPPPPPPPEDEPPDGPPLTYRPPPAVYSTPVVSGAPGWVDGHSPQKVVDVNRFVPMRRGQENEENGVVREEVEVDGCGGGEAGVFGGGAGLGAEPVTSQQQHLIQRRVVAARRKSASAARQGLGAPSSNDSILLLDAEEESAAVQAPMAPTASLSVPAGQPSPRDDDGTGAPPPALQETHPAQPLSKVSDALPPPPPPPPPSLPMQVAAPVNAGGTNQEAESSTAKPASSSGMSADLGRVVDILSKHINQVEHRIGARLVLMDNRLRALERQKELEPLGGK